ncbi:MAG TPA: hypothetical protein DIU39_10610 [Flavobacteriales bacterium]|nr:hypothetical protein [Flavobacteriales bacterium]|tara:strand:+ start:209 stop:577 length:369 start_codon:yes stop_codon:yes gene_type:complete
METFSNYISNAFCLTNFLSGIIYIITGLILLKFPPKKINHLYGYRTARSMKSQKHWDYAQRISAKKIILYGCLFIFLSFAGFFIPLNNKYLALLAIGSVIVLSVIYILDVEGALKKKFPEED